MQVVDAHVHFWDLDAVALPWLMPAREAYSGDNRRLPRRYTPADLLAQARADGIDVLKLVNIEANPREPLAETQWLQALADDGGAPQAIVAAADLSSPDALDLLARHAQSPNLRGIRQILNVHDDPRYDYVGRHYMREETWCATLGALAGLGLSFDLQIYPAQAPLAARIAARHPELCFIVNHTGMCVDHDIPGWRAWRDGLRTLAACRNVCIKISGLAMFDHHWTTDSLRPYVLEAIEIFGTQRCMFASNFPIDGLHSGYGALWQAYAEIVSFATAAERHALFVGNAERCYRI